MQQANIRSLSLPVIVQILGNVCVCILSPGRVVAKSVNACTVLPPCMCVCVCVGVD